MAHQIQLKRRLAATPAEVYAAWTDPRSLAQWMRPCHDGARSADVTADARVGGRYRIDMYDEDGELHPHEGEYLRLEPSRLLEFVWVSEHTQRQRSIVTVELQPVGRDETELTLTHRLLPSEEAAKGHHGGWTMILDNLAAVLKPQRARGPQQAGAAQRAP